MTQIPNPPVEPNQPSSSPPTQGEAVRPPSSAAVWPQVIGIIGIVVGALGVTCGFGGFFQFLVPVPPAPPNADAEQVAQALKELRFWQTVATFGTVGTLALSGILVWFGILLLNRRRLALRIAMPWAVTDIVWTLAMSLVNFQIQKATMAIQLGADPTGGLFTETFAGIAAFIGAAVGCALPVFILIWFNRLVIQAQMQDWT